jgi:6-phosphogluconate dehydrogenase
MGRSTYDIGMIGLGVMGRNLALNMADRGFAVAGYNRHLDKVVEFEREAEGKSVLGARSVEELVKALRPPRAVMIMVPAGPPVDEVIGELLPFLEPKDLIIDGGNSYYKDTDRRAETLADQSVQFLGVGISGGEKGARFGPSMMPGGQQEAYERVRPIFEAVAARVDGEPCVKRLGPGSAGHYVKMVHNGIEYGLMQLISETYDLMKRGLDLNNNELADIYLDWNRGELQSFLVEITSEIFRRTDDKTGRRLIDEILDKAAQKGTGKWTSQNAMDLHVPVSTIDTAVAMRDLSAYKDQREEAATYLCGATPSFEGPKQAFVGLLRNALYASVIVTYAQGMALLKAASEAYHYDLLLQDVAGVWRGGCIIRARVLNEIRSAFEHQPHLPNLMLDAALSKSIVERQNDLRQVIQSAVAWGVPAPAMMACLAYFDGFRSSWLPANLIQAQRDYFGSHTYERVDEKGVFHTIWEEA